MQRFALIFALASGALALNYVGNHLKKHVTHAKVHEAFNNKYTRNSSVSKCADFDTEMHKATSATTTCIHKNYDSEKVSFCHFTEQGLRECLNGPRLLLDRCMPPKSEGLPDLGFEMLFAFLNFTCKAQGSQLIELTNPCITLTLKNYALDGCEDQMELQVMEVMGPEMCLSKSGLCKLAESFRTCLISLFNEHCSSSVTRANFFKFYDAILVPCKKLGV